MHIKHPRKGIIYYMGQIKISCINDEYILYNPDIKKPQKEDACYCGSNKLYKDCCANKAFRKTRLVLSDFLEHPKGMKKYDNLKVSFDKYEQINDILLMTINGTNIIKDDTLISREIYFTRNSGKDKVICRFPIRIGQMPLNHSYLIVIDTNTKTIGDISVSVGSLLFVHNTNTSLAVDPRIKLFFNKTSEEAEKYCYNIVALNARKWFADEGFILAEDTPIFIVADHDFKSLNSSNNKYLLKRDMFYLYATADTTDLLFNKLIYCADKISSNVLSMIENDSFIANNLKNNYGNTLDIPIEIKNKLDEFQKKALESAIAILDSQIKIKGETKIKTHPISMIVKEFNA